jgi:hypothetical protein
MSFSLSCSWVIQSRAGLGLCSAGLGWAQAGSGWLGLARALHCGLGLLLAWPGGWAWGLACGLSPKTRPARARAWARSGPNPKPFQGWRSHVRLVWNRQVATLFLILIFFITTFLFEDNNFFSRYFFFRRRSHKKSFFVVSVDWATNPSNVEKPRIARWFVFKPKIPIWVNFGGP